MTIPSIEPEDWVELIIFPKRSPRRGNNSGKRLLNQNTLRKGKVGVNRDDFEKKYYEKHRLIQRYFLQKIITGFTINRVSAFFGGYGSRTKPDCPCHSLLFAYLPPLSPSINRGFTSLIRQISRSTVHLDYQHSQSEWKTPLPGCNRLLSYPR